MLDLSLGHSNKNGSKTCALNFKSTAIFVVFLSLIISLTGEFVTAQPSPEYLKEANVRDVEVNNTGSEYRFSVTLQHNDSAEDGYANWWQVETLDGRHLGRRTLLHAHGNQPFTRSSKVNIPEDISTVVIRGHDQTHGYGGQAIVYQLDEKKQRIVKQGTERQQIQPSVKQDITLTVLGSGGPVANNERASSGYVISLEGEPKFILEAGGGVHARVGELGLDISTVDAYFLSHLHVDHTTDLPALLKTQYFQGRGAEPLKIYGPTGNDQFPGIKQWMSKLFDKKTGVYNYMSGFAKLVTNGEFNVNSEEINATLTDDNSPVTILRDEDWTVKAIPVKHGPMPTVAYRFNHDNRSVTFSGDLNSESGNLQTLAQKTDLLIYDVSLNSKVPNDAVPAKLHSYPKEVGQVAQQSNAGRLLLSHLMPPAESQINEVKHIISGQFDGSMRVASDGLELTISDQ